MNREVAHTDIDYFKSYSNYFWSWEDNGEVIQSKQTNSTIGYREDVFKLLEDISNTISPRFGSVLLVLFSCSHQYKAFSYNAIKQIINDAENDDNVSYEVLEYHIVKAFKLLNRINILPNNLKKGQKRILLLTEVLKENQLSIPNYKTLLKNFNSGQFDDVIFKNTSKISYSELFADFHVLSNAENQFSNAKILQEKLETGIVGLKKQEFFLEKKDVLNELLKERETAPLGDLAKHFMGSLKIPISLESTSDLSLGGVSDVSNKGDFDKLLLSELAYSDDIFLSRLINNEALYFKREASPENLSKNRIVLLDTTIKVWGTPRILGLALTLAFKYHPKSNVNTKLFLLDGETYVHNDLNNTSQIKDVLRFLSPYLDCSSSLKSVLDTDHIKKEDEVILVIEESNFKQEKLQKIFNLNKQKINFLVTIKRDGHINYFSIVNESLKKLGSVIIDIEKVVDKKRTFGINNFKSKMPSKLPFTPVFFHNAPSYPILNTATEYVNESSLIYLPKGGCIVKNRFNELVYYPKYSVTRKSGYVIKNNIGNYHFKFALSHSKTEVYFLTYTIKRLAGFSIINLDDFSVNYHDLKTSIPFEFHNLKVSTFGELFYVNTSNKKYLFNKTEMHLTIVDQIKSDEKKSPKDRIMYDTAHVETPFVKINKVRITSDSCLVFNDKKLDFQQWDNERLHFVHESRISLRNKEEKYTYLVTENITVLKKVYLFDNPKLKFRHVKFKDGSEILFDNKGFSHLKSSDESLPEITIKIQLNSSASFFISTGSISAKSYLVNDEMMMSSIKASQVHTNYLKPFIQNILNAY